MPSSGFRPEDSMSAEEEACMAGSSQGKEERADTSPMGTEGCLWDEEYWSAWAIERED